MNSSSSSPEISPKAFVRNARALSPSPRLNQCANAAGRDKPAAANQRVRSDSTRYHGIRARSRSESKRSETVNLGTKAAETTNTIHIV